MPTPIFSLNDTSTQVLMAKQLKENIYLELLHRDGKGVTEHHELNASTVRVVKFPPLDGDAREIGASTNGGFFGNTPAKFTKSKEYDLNLTYVYDQNFDLPEVQQDMVPMSIIDETTKNIAGAVKTNINASTIAVQLANRFNAADTANAWAGIAVEIGENIAGTKNNYAAFMNASTMLDNGDEENGIQSFPFEKRECLVRPSFRLALMDEKGVILGGSNYAQSMLAKGALSPEQAKEFGTMYIGEIDLVPCFLCPDGIWKKAGAWVGSATAFNDVQGLMVAGDATDRGISTQDYIKVIDSPDGAGKRLQPKVRWGINVDYGKGIVPIVAHGATVPASQLTVTAPGSRA